MTGELLLFAAALALVVALALAYAVLLRPQDSQRRAILARAQADFGAARGTQHLRLLRKAEAQKLQSQRQVTAALQAAQAAGAALTAEREGALVAALENYLARERFELEVDGVGPVLAERILQRAFRGKLHDLTGASYYVEGIGASRQQAIDDWVRDCRRRQKVLLTGDFPGKAEVLQRYDSRLDQAQAEAARLTGEAEQLDRQLMQITAAISGLQRVTVHDFARALSRPGAESPALSAYLRGVHAPWEPPPAWFAGLVEEQP